MIRLSEFRFKTDSTIRRDRLVGICKMAEKEKIEVTVRRRGCFLLLGLPNGLLTFSAYLTHAVFTDLIVYSTCVVSMNINVTDCLALRSNAGSQEAMDLEAEVEPHASMIVMAKELLRNVLPTVVSLLLVPWSDRGGRRPVLLSALGGCVVSYAALTFMSNWIMSPWYLIIAMVPSKIFGGTSIVRTASLCYISDVTAEIDRTTQLTMLEAAILTGRVLGALAGSLIYKNYGYSYTFGAASFCSLSSLAYTYFLVPESVTAPPKESVRGSGKIWIVKGLFTMSSVDGDILRRSLIWFAILTLTLNKLIDKGYKSIEFLFTRTRLGWDVQDYSYFSAASTTLRISGLCIASIRSRFLGASDTRLILIGFLSALGGTVTKSLTWQSWHMYLSLGIDLLGAITIPVIRSVISKSVSSQDVGKIFSLASLLQILGSIGGTPLYTLIYSNYLPPIYPSPVYLVSVGIYLLSILCLICMEVLIRKSRTRSTYTAAAQEDFES